MPVSNKDQAKWFLDQLKKTFSNDKKDIDKKDVNNPEEMKDKIQNYFMFTMVYDALHKDKLFSWDSIPLFFPVGMTNVGKGLKIQGINIHFLEPKNRIVFINELITLMKKVAEKKKFDPNDLDSVPDNVFQPVISKFMQGVYEGRINSAGKHIKVSYRSYFLNRIKSRLVRIPFSEYELAAKVMLPKFSTSRSKTYSWIKEMYNRYKGSNWEL